MKGRRAVSREKVKEEEEEKARRPRPHTHRSPGATRSRRRSQQISYLSLIDRYPVGAAEPLVVLDVSDAVLQITEALRQVHLQQVLQQVFQLVREV